MASAVIAQSGYQPMYKGIDPLVMQESASPIQVQGDSILLNLKAMESNKFYLVTLNDEPYVYRKNSEGDVEVYGLANI